jgi:hypothetical protein
LISEELKVHCSFAADGALQALEKLVKGSSDFRCCV